MNKPSRHWEALFHPVPLRDVPRHYAGIAQSPFTLQYLTTVLGLCPRGRRTCEIGSDTGYGAIWLSQRGCVAEGVNDSPAFVERARQVNNIAGGEARFRVADPFDLFHSRNDGSARAYSVIHHLGLSNAQQN